MIQFDKPVFFAPNTKGWLKGEKTSENLQSVKVRQSRLRKNAAKERTQRVDVKHSLTVYDGELLSEQRKADQREQRQNARRLKRLQANEIERHTSKYLRG